MYFTRRVNAYAYDAPITYVYYERIHSHVCVCVRTNTRAPVCVCESRMSVCVLVKHILYTHMNARLSVIHTRVYVQIHARLHVYVSQAYLCVYINTRAHTNLVFTRRVHKSSYKRSSICVCIHTYTIVCVCM